LQAMTATVKAIKAPIVTEMENFEQKFKSSMKSKAPLLDRITHYIVKRKGKQMRPMFVFLCAKMCGEVTEQSYTGASLIELLHTATLVHDDVVDDAHLRRGFFSVNALWKNKIAVLVGDYLFSKGLLLSVEQNQFELLKIVSNAVKEMSEGELLQIEKTRKLNLDEDVYFDIIRQKTASLIAACCAVGAASVDSSAETIEKMRIFGEYVGMAFQIKDDLFDFGGGVAIGKPTGIDIKEKKITLPLIYTIAHSKPKQRRALIKLIKKHYDKPERVKEVVAAVVAGDGLEYAKQKMFEYKNLALKILEEFEE
jgi:octaprenyl-diphosphate synthase